jgi:hypothetical protein
MLTTQRYEPDYHHRMSTDDNLGGYQPAGGKSQRFTNVDEQGV